MFRFLISIIFFSVFTFSFAQQVNKAAAKPPYRYIYAVTKEQAWKINNKKFKEVYTEDFLSNAVDSITVLDKIPAKYCKGGYIILSPNGTYLNAHFIGSNKISVRVITVPSEIGLSIHNVTNQSLSDVRFYTEEKQIQLKHNGYYYVISEELYGKTLMVECNDEIFLIDTPPSLPKRKYNKKINDRIGNSGFVLTDKPKYHTGDTVFIKGYFSPTLFPKKTSLKIWYSAANYKSVDVLKRKVRKDKFGSYTSYFVLPDSLPIDLKYSVSLSQNQRSRTNYFRIEDYKLDDFLLDAEVGFGQKYQDSITIRVHYTTPQGDPINSGWIFLNIEPTSMRLKGLKDAYVPYSILKDSIQAVGKTTYTYKAKMPELPYGNYSMELTLQVSNNGLVEEVIRSFEYDYRPVVMTHTIQGHICTFNPYSKVDASVNKGFALYGNSNDLDTIAVSFPYQVDLQEQKIPTAFIVQKSYMSVNAYEIMNQALTYNYSIQQNKIALQIENPFQFKIRITDNEGQLLYDKSEPSVIVTVPLEKNQLLHCDYIIQGNYTHKRLLISPDYQSLIIDASIPDTITPGAGARATVQVTDIEHKPVRKANITAVAIDNRLEHDGIPNAIALIQYKYDEQSNQFEDYANIPGIKDTSISKHVYEDYNQFLYDDSINYFLIPKSYDSLTEAFIYMYKNATYIRPGYVFEDGKPVYWCDMEQSSSQSFYTTEGYHDYEIRLPDETIFIDSIFIYPLFKNNILIPVERLPSNRYHSIPRPKRLTDAERDTLYQYLYEIKVRSHFSLETRTNYYYSLYGTETILNEDSDFHVISDSASIVTKKQSASGVNKKRSDYLRRQRFRNLKSTNTTISMSELKTFERSEYIRKKNPCIYYPIDISVYRSNDYATLYINGHFPHKTIFKLIDPNNVERIDSNQYSNYVRYDVVVGEYRLQILNSKRELLKEQKISIAKPGYYMVEVFPEICIETSKGASDTDIYTKSDVHYPSETMYYKAVYSNQDYRSRSRRKRIFRSNYLGVFGGLNSIYTGPSTLSSGYQFGAIVGNQFTNHIKAELRFSYSETATDMQLPYNYSYGKIGLMGWYSFIRYSRDFDVFLGSGIAGQYIFDAPSKNSGVAIPIGAAVKFPSIYFATPYVEVIWNRTIFGTDYSYSNKGIWEVNLRFNIRIARRGRVICPSNFWGPADEVVITTPRYRYEEVGETTIQSITLGSFAEDLTYKKRIENVSEVTTVAVRSNFYDRAYWIPSFTTDANGNATFSATYPDALTHWNNYIIAHKRKQSNTWQSQTTTYLSNYVQLYVPRFVIGGDSVSAAYHVQSADSFLIQHTVEGLRINESRSADGTYSFYASEAADTIHCTSALIIDNKQVDGEQRLIPVYKAGNETYTGMYEYVTGDTLFNIHKSDSAIETKLYLSNNLQDFVRMQYKHLMDYSYSCNEQTASKLIGAIAGKELNGNYHGNHPQNFYAKLKKNINDGGMYGWWGNSSTDVSMSAYVFYALKIYYKSAGIPVDRFYTNLGARVIENAAYHKVNYFTYWLMKESDLPMDNIALQSAEPKTYKEEILALRIRQLQGDTIKRSEVEKYVSQTILGNTALHTSDQFQSTWHDNELMYLILLHKIAKTDYPDIAATIRKGLIEHGSLSEYAPTYVKALFINEFYQLNAVQKNTAVVTCDNVSVNSLPLSKTIKDSLHHAVSITDASGMYVVQSEKQIRTTSVRHSGLEIDYVFKENGKTISSLQSGRVVEQIVTLKVSKSCSYVMVEIPMAAGCMLEDIATSCPGLLSHREVFRDKIILYFDSLPEGTYTFTIREKVLFKGNYQLNPCSVNLMYFPMIQTQTAVRRIKIH